MEIDEWYEYCEPANKRCDPQYVRVSRKTAIQCARESAEAAGHFGISDEDLLLDFIAVNWATKV